MFAVPQEPAIGAGETVTDAQEIAAEDLPVITSLTMSDAAHVPELLKIGEKVAAEPECPAPELSLQLYEQLPEGQSVIEPVHVVEPPTVIDEAPVREQEPLGAGQLVLDGADTEQVESLAPLQIMVPKFEWPQLFWDV